MLETTRGDAAAFVGSRSKKRGKKPRKRRNKKRFAKVVAGSSLPSKPAPLPGRATALALALLLAGVMALAAMELIRVSQWASAHMPGLLSLAIRGVLLLLGVGLLIRTTDAASRRLRSVFYDVGAPYQFMLVGFAIFSFGQTGGIRMAHELEQSPPITLSIGELVSPPSARFVEFTDAVLRPEVHFNLSQQDPNTEMDEWFTATGITGPEHQSGDPVPLWTVLQGNDNVVTELPLPIRGAVVVRNSLGRQSEKSNVSSATPSMLLLPSSDGYDETLKRYRENGERALWWIASGVFGLCFFFGVLRVVTR